MPMVNDDCKEIIIIITIITVVIIIVYRAVKCTSITVSEGQWCE